MKKMTEKEAKQCMINILSYIDNICRKNKINYSIYYGSLIGAIRHKGIIPWDDDIDIILLKEDYDKLIKILKTQNNEYKILDETTDTKCVLPFAKLVNTKTYIEQDNMNKDNNMGLFVDIFCFNNFPDKDKKLYYKKIIFYKLLIDGLNYKNFKKGEDYYYLKKVRNIIAKIFGKKYLMKKYIKLCNKYNYCKTNRVISNWPEYYNPLEKEIVNKSEFKNFIRVDFENIKVMITKDYDILLKRYFGDYMTPPPKEKRINHGFNAYWR